MHSWRRFPGPSRDRASTEGAIDRQCRRWRLHCPTISQSCWPGTGRSRPVAILVAPIYEQVALTCLLGKLAYSVATGYAG